MQAISYTDGDFVKKGTSLFTIEPEPYKLKVEAAKAAVASAQATLKQAEAEYQRQADLVSRQVSTQANYDKALAQRDSAQADLQSAQANEQQAEINLGYTNVTAPFDGIVTRAAGLDRPTGRREFGRPVLATIVQLDPIYVNFTASERDVLQVRADAGEDRGARPPICSASRSKSGCKPRAGYPHQGKLDYVAPTVDPSTGTLAARAILHNADRSLLPGYFVRVRDTVAGRSRRCWCPMSRSAAIRAGATCWWSTRTTSSSSARSSRASWSATCA